MEKKNKKKKTLPLNTKNRPEFRVERMYISVSSSSQFPCMSSYLRDPCYKTKLAGKIGLYKNSFKYLKENKGSTSHLKVEIQSNRSEMFDDYISFSLNSKDHFFSNYVQTYRLFKKKTTFKCLRSFFFIAHKNTRYYVSYNSNITFTHTHLCHSYPLIPTGL